VVCVNKTMIIGYHFFLWGYKFILCGTHILTPFSEYLSNYDSTHDFQQDSATAHSQQFYALVTGCLW
jgi:hypothetical protein